MINLQKTNLYKSLKLEANQTHAYMFYSLDKELNNSVALTFAKNQICENNSACGLCSKCLQFDNLSYPDFYLFDLNQFKVEDANILVSKLDTTPISGDKKVFVILNAETINETAQNKLLKSFEEPNSSTLFILTSSKLDKILPTILSRMKKIFVPSLSLEDKKLLSSEIMKENLDYEKFVNSNLNLSELALLTKDADYIKITESLKDIFKNLKSSQDVPKCTTKTTGLKKDLFFSTLENLFLDCLKGRADRFDKELLELVRENFNKKTLMNCLPFIEEAYKKHMSNVNFTYIVDNLLFDILKEKFLCK